MTSHTSGKMRLRDEVVGNRRLIEHGGLLHDKSVQRQNKEVPKSCGFALNLDEI